MADEQHRDQVDHDKAPRREYHPDAPGGDVGLFVPEPLPLPADPRALLSDPRLNGRGNAPMRQAAVRQIQQTQGNRAVQRALDHIARSAPVPIQRARMSPEEEEWRRDAAVTDPYSTMNYHLTPTSTGVQAGGEALHMQNELARLDFGQVKVNTGTWNDTERDTDEDGPRTGAQIEASAAKAEFPGGFLPDGTRMKGGFALDDVEAEYSAGTNNATINASADLINVWTQFGEASARRDTDEITKAKLGVGKGKGTNFQFHSDDQDKDGLPEYGFHSEADLGPLAHLDVDYRTEDPVRSLAKIGAGALGPAGMLLTNQLLPKGNMTRAVTTEMAGLARRRPDWLNLLGQ